jgi:glycosyltransferase involved in cell wall biosynthesis
MAEEFERRYGLPFLPFMNCVDVRQRTIYSRRPSSSNLFRLAYVGGLHLNRGKALLDIAHVLRELQKEGLHGEIVIYGGRDATEYFTGLNVPATMRFATEDEKSLLDTSNAAVEAFVHVDSFYREDMSYLRFSLSAKIPWCMSAGVPFFAYGPADIGTIKYLRQTGAAVIVDSQDPAFLREELRRLLRDIALQRQLGRAARRMAEDNHDASIVREKFRCVLAAVTTNK